MLCQNFLALLLGELFRHSIHGCVEALPQLCQVSLRMGQRVGRPTGSEAEAPWNLAQLSARPQSWGQQPYHKLLCSCRAHQPQIVERPLWKLQCTCRADRADLKFKGSSPMAILKLHVLSSHPARRLATSSHGCMHAKGVGHQKVWLGPADLQTLGVTPAQAVTGWVPCSE